MRHLNFPIIAAFARSLLYRIDQRRKLAPSRHSAFQIKDSAGPDGAQHGAG
jgi:hypothetical protein